MGLVRREEYKKDLDSYSVTVSVAGRALLTRPEEKLFPLLERSFPALDWTSAGLHLTVITLRMFLLVLVL